MNRAADCWVATEAEALVALLERRGQLPALDAGRVFVDGKRANTATLLTSGARVEVYAPRDAPAPIEVLLRRGGLVFALKPVGIATEPERRGSEHALVNLVAELFSVSPTTVSALTRLDVGVSGVVLLALDGEARQRVARSREQGTFERRYVALASAAPSPPNGVWNDPIGRASGGARRTVHAQGEAAETQYLVTGVSPTERAVLALRPRTGRTHQLRVHASAHGAPLLGDTTYGAPKHLVLGSGEVVGFDRIYLHAAWLAIAGLDPVSAPLPVEFEGTWRRLLGDPTSLERALSEPMPG